MQNDVKLYGADVHGVRQMVIYGLKGLASYARHAELLGQWDQKVGEFVHEVRKVSCTETDQTLGRHQSINVIPSIASMFSSKQDA